MAVLLGNSIRATGASLEPARKKIGIYRSTLGTSLYRISALDIFTDGVCSLLRYLEKRIDTTTANRLSSKCPGLIEEHLGPHAASGSWP